MYFCWDKWCDFLAGDMIFLLLIQWTFCYLVIVDLVLSWWLDIINMTVDSGVMCDYCHIGNWNIFYWFPDYWFIIWTCYILMQLTLPFDSLYLGIMLDFWLALLYSGYGWVNIDWTLFCYKTHLVIILGFGMIWMDVDCLVLVWMFWMNMDFLDSLD